MKFFNFKNIFISLIISNFIFLSGCGLYKKSDARKVPGNAKERVKQNMKEGKRIRFGNLQGGSGKFEFASSNEMWRASIEILDFIPLSNADYGGGIIITDWYSDNSADNESIKITIRFLTSEVRSDAIEVTIFKKDCNAENKCSIYQEDGDLTFQVKKSILKKAALYKEEKIKKNRKPYDPGGDGVSGGTTIF